MLLTQIQCYYLTNKTRLLKINYGKFFISQQLKTKGKVLLAGCGELGIQTAGLLQADHYEVVGARRTIQSLPKSIAALSIDITEPASLAVLSEQWDAVIITLTADSFTVDAYRRTYIEGLHNVLQSLRRPLSDQAVSPLVLFASSTRKSMVKPMDHRLMSTAPLYPRAFLARPCWQPRH